MKDPRRRLPVSKLRLLFRRLEILHQLSQRNEIDLRTAQLIQQTAATAYEELKQWHPWVRLNKPKRSEEIRSAARSAGLVLTVNGQEISNDVLAYRLKFMARYRESDMDTVPPPGYWFVAK